MAEGLFSFIANDPEGYSAMEMRRRIAMQMLGQSNRKGYPKTLGEGLAHIGDTLGDIAMWRALQDLNKKQQDADTKAVKDITHKPGSDGGDGGDGGGDKGGGKHADAGSTITPTSSPTIPTPRVAEGMPSDAAVALANEDVASKLGSWGIGEDIAPGGIDVASNDVNVEPNISPAEMEQARAAEQLAAQQANAAAHARTADPANNVYTGSTMANTAPWFGGQTEAYRQMTAPQGPQQIGSAAPPSQQVYAEAAPRNILAEQRAPLVAQIENDPARLNTMLGLMSAEEGPGSRNSIARIALAESALNRGVSRGYDDVSRVLDPRYYQPMHARSGNTLDKHLALIQRDPAYRAQLLDEFGQVKGGSNVSNLATDNASGKVAANSRTNQTVAFEAPNRELFTRKDVRPDIHGAGAVRRTAGWFGDTSHALENGGGYDNSSVMAAANLPPLNAGAGGVQTVQTVQPPQVVADATPPPPQQMAASPTEAAQADTLGQLSGMTGGGAETYPATASLGRVGDVQSDVPNATGISPVGGATGQSIADTAQARRDAITHELMKQPTPAPAEEVPQPNPPQTSGTSPTTSMSPSPTSASTAPSSPDERLAQAFPDPGAGPPMAILPRSLTSAPPSAVRPVVDGRTAIPAAPTPEEFNYEKILRRPPPELPRHPGMGPEERRLQHYLTDDVSQRVREAAKLAILNERQIINNKYEDQKAIAEQRYKIWAEERKQALDAWRHARKERADTATAELTAADLPGKLLDEAEKRGLDITKLRQDILAGRTKFEGGKLWHMDDTGRWSDVTPMPKVRRETEEPPIGNVNEHQSKSVHYGKQMMNAEKDLQDADLQETASAIFSGTPFVGNALQSAKYRSAANAAQRFILGKLRDDSGATIGTEEYKREWNAFFPGPLDSPQDVKAKAEARKIAIQGMIDSAGPGAENLSWFRDKMARERAEADARRARGEPAAGAPRPDESSAPVLPDPEPGAPPATPHTIEERNALPPGRRYVIPYGPNAGQVSIKGR